MLRNDNDTVVVFEYNALKLAIPQLNMASSVTRFICSLDYFAVRLNIIRTFISK